MALPNADIQTIADLLEILSSSVSARLNDKTTDPDDEQLIDLVEQLRDIFNTLAANTRKPNGDEASEFCEYALQALTRVAQLMSDINDRESADLAGDLSVRIALWAAELNGKITTLEQVIDTLAHIANDTREPDELADLSAIMGQLIDATADEIKQDLDNSNPSRPWRVLNVNRGIVATRSQSPETMNAAFEALVRNLPADAVEFFNEGMSEMERLDYPRHVRRVMERYYNEFSQRGTVH